METLVIQYADYIAIAVATIILAERIARITPTETDNKVLQWVRKIANVVGINVPDIK